MAERDKTLEYVLIFNSIKSKQPIEVILLFPFEN